MNIGKGINDFMNDLDNVYPVRARPEVEDPYVVYRFSTEYVRAQGSIPIYEVTLTVDIFGKDFSDFYDKAVEVTAFLEALSGASALGDLTVLVVNFESESEAEWLSDLEKYSLTQTYQILIEE